MLAKLGKKTKMDGNWLNKKNSTKTLALLKHFSIDLSRLTIKQDCGTEEIVITDSNSRTVFGNYASFHNGKRQWNTPQQEDIQKAAFVSLDPYFKEGSLK
jgi:hypothetical protein